MGARAYFSDGRLILPREGTTLEDVKQALIDHFDLTDTSKDVDLEDILYDYHLCLDSMNVSDRHDSGRELVALIGNEDEISLIGVGTRLEEALKAIAPFVEPSTSTYLSYSDSDGDFWRYIVRDGKLLSIVGEIAYDESLATLVE